MRLSVRVGSRERGKRANYLTVNVQDNQLGTSVDMPRNSGTRMGDNSLDDSQIDNKETEPNEKMKFDSL